jgi:hypothetical protein
MQQDIEHAERLARIETILANAFGADGTNGRMGKLESRISTVEKQVTYWMGGLATLGGLGGLVAVLLKAAH